jgi:hypothetical protein
MAVRTAEWRRALVFIVAIGLGGLVGLVVPGCQKTDEIEAYTVPKPKRHRLLLATVSQGVRTWCFEMVGPEKQVAKHKQEFDDFLKHVDFSRNDELIGWKVPQSWKTGPTAPMRYATWLPDPEDRFLQVSLFNFGGGAQSQSVQLMFINLRRAQLALPRASGGELSELAQYTTIGGLPAISWDMGSPSPDKPIDDKFLAEYVNYLDSPWNAPPLSYNTPSGWRKILEPGKFSLAAYEAILGKKEPRVAIAPLPGHGGGLLQNINRWRGQIGLQPLAEEDEDKLGEKEIKLANARGLLLDMEGPRPKDGGSPQRILAVITRHEDMTWFFTLKGPTELVGEQKAAFQEFIGSVRFGDGKRGQP